MLACGPHQWCSRFTPSATHSMRSQLATSSQSPHQLGAVGCFEDDGPPSAPSHAPAQHTTAYSKQHTALPLKTRAIPSPCAPHCTSRDSTPHSVVFPATHPATHAAALPVQLLRGR